MNGPPIYGQCPHCLQTLRAGHVCPEAFRTPPAPPKVVTLYETNHRDVPATLRVIAAEIEAGRYGPVGCAGLVLLGDRMEVFAMGTESEPPAVALLLHAGFASISRAIEDHGKA